MARDDAGPWSVGLLMVLAALLWAHPAIAQCAMCRRALETPEGRQLAAAFRGGILVLLAAPFSLVAVIATLVVRMKKSKSA